VNKIAVKELYVDKAWGLLHRARGARRWYTKIELGRWKLQTLKNVIEELGKKEAVEK